MLLGLDDKMLHITGEKYVYSVTEKLKKKDSVSIEHRIIAVLPL